MEASSEESLTDLAQQKPGRRPTYDFMVKKAIAGLQSKRGSSTKAITQFVSSHFKVEGAKSKKAIATALKRMVSKGLILKNASGNSFKLTKKGRKMRRVGGRKRRSRRGRKGRKTRRRRRRGRKGRKGRKGRRRRRRRGRKARKGRKSRRRRRRRGRKAAKGKKRSRRGRSRRRRR